jgi:putative membrane protein
MDSLFPLALVVHILGFALWMSGLYGIAETLVARNDEKDEAFRAKIGALARRAGRSADVGAALAIVAGVALLLTNPSRDIHQPWMHAKLTLVVAFLGLHGFLRVKAKKASQGQLGAFPSAILPLMTLMALTIIALAVFKPWHR